MRKRALIRVGLGVALCILLSGVVIADLTPIVDGTGLPGSIDDSFGHKLLGLQVERGDGFVTMVLPRSSDHQTVWGIHGFVTFSDASVVGVFWPWGSAPPENGGDNGWASIIGGTYSDEVDFVGDSARVTSGARGVAATNEAEFWMATNSGQDAFKIDLTYGFCPYMRVEHANVGETSYNMNLHWFEIGNFDFAYGVDIPLANCVRVEIDIKPGGYPNCFNVNGHGVIPVAILGSDTFDVTQINVEALSFAGLSVAIRGKDRPLCSVQDVSGDFTFPEGAPDGYDDLVCQFEDVDGAFIAGDGFATVTGSLTDGSVFEGSDEICMRPE